MANPSTDASASRSEKRRNLRRNQILRAAIDMFAERGFHAASIAEIIDRADIARGTFYLYFESKHAVFESILEESLSQLRALVKPIDLEPEAQPPLEQLRENLVRTLGYVTADRGLATILLNPSLGPDDEIADRLDGFYAEVRSLIEVGLGHGIRLKLVRECDIPTIAAACLGAVRGVARHLILEGDPSKLEAAIGEVIQFALTGVMAPGIRPG